MNKHLAHKPKGSNYALWAKTLLLIASAPLIARAAPNYTLQPIASATQTPTPAIHDFSPVTDCQVISSSSSLSSPTPTQSSSQLTVALDHPFQQMGAGEIHRFDVSGDGREIAVGRTSGLFIYEAFTFNPLWNMPTESPVINVVYSADGRGIAAVLADKHVMVWDSASHQVLQTLPPQPKQSFALALSPDGTLLATGDDNGLILIWEVATAKPIRVLENHAAGEVYNLAFKPDGIQLAATYDTKMDLVIWNTINGRPEHCFRNAGVSVAWSADGHQVGTSANGHLNFWNTSTWVLIGHQVNEYEYGNVSFGPKGAFRVAGGWEFERRSHNGQIGYTYNYYWGEMKLCIGEATHCQVMEKGGLSQLLFVPSGNELAAINKGRLEIWNYQKGNLEYSYKGSARYRTLRLSPDGKLLIIGTDHPGGIRLWDLTNRQWAGHFGSDLDAADSVAISNDGRWVAASLFKLGPLNDTLDNTVVVWDRWNNHIVQSQSLEHNRVWALDFTADGKSLEANTPNGVIRWDLASWKQTVDPSSQLYGYLMDRAISNDGKLIASYSGAASPMKGVTISERATNRRICNLQEDFNDTYILSFNPNNTLLLIANASDTTLINTRSCQKIRVLENTTMPIAWSSDNHWLATNSAGVIQLWNLTDDLPTQ